MSLEELFECVNDLDPLLKRDPALDKKVSKALRKVTKAVKKAKDKQIENNLVESTHTEATESAISAEKTEYTTYEDFDYEKLLTYAGVDCIATSELVAKRMPEYAKRVPYLEVDHLGAERRILAKSVLEHVLDVEMKAQEFIIDLEITGWLYDVGKNRQMSKDMIEVVNALEDKIFSAIGKKINLDSGVEVSNLLYGELGFQAPYQTKSGADATDGDALLLMAGIDPKSGKYVAEDERLQFLADMAKRKDVNSTHNTFVKTYVEDFVKRDGRIHPSYNLFGTSSFRITGSDPNLTQTPRPNHGFNVRETFIVPPGHCLIAADWSSAEVKILGALSKDSTLLKAIADGLDFHSFSASQMVGVPYNEFIEVLAAGGDLAKSYKGLRQSAKALTFGIN